MKKNINSRVIAQVKNIYKFNEQNYATVARLDEKIAELTAQRDAAKAAIDLAEKPVVEMLGYKSSDLIEVVVTPLFNEDGTPKMDKEGKYQMKKKQYVCKYGPAFLPSEGGTLAEPEPSQAATEETEQPEGQPAEEETPVETPTL